MILSSWSLWKYDSPEYLRRDVCWVMYLHRVSRNYWYFSVLLKCADDFGKFWQAPAMTKIRAALIVLFINLFNNIRYLKGFLFSFFWSKIVWWKYLCTSVCSKTDFVWHQFLSFVEGLQLFQKSKFLILSMPVGAALASPSILCLICIRGKRYMLIFMNVLWSLLKLSLTVQFLQNCVFPCPESVFF